MLAQSNGNFMLVNKNSTRCMAIGASATENGVKVIQWGCHGGADEMWKPEPEAGGWFRLLNKNSGRCLAVPSALKDQGVRLIQWDCHDGADERWRLVRLD